MPRQYKGIYYFASQDDATIWAKQNDWPTDRIIEYGRGFAVQAGPSGNYAGPFMSPLTWAEAFQQRRIAKHA